MSSEPYNPEFQRRNRKNLSELFDAILGAEPKPLTPKIEELLCNECGHPISLHDANEGCTYERGDAYISGFAPMAQGPCGCAKPADDGDMEYSNERIAEADERGDDDRESTEERYRQ